VLEIKTTGFDDYLDKSANIKTMVIGGPGAGKTRWSSFWPKPIFIDCEDGLGSIADRSAPYVRVRTSKDMLDVLAFLKDAERTPKAQRQHQTVIVDTADSFQRIVKEEWVTANKAGSFTGFDAWGYLDTKMQLLFTRLLNLDYNVIVLVHFKSKEHKDGDNTVREFVLQLQGAISDQVFNDFGLVGWMGTYWEAGEEGRVQKRGLTFQPSPEKPFLKDRFHVTPKWLEVQFSEDDYNQLFEAFMSRADSLPEVGVVGNVPDHDPAAVNGAVAAPQEGGPVAPRPPVDVATIPLDKQTKPQLEETAKGLGITVRGNTLKAEIISAIEHARAAASGVAPAVEAKPEPKPEVPTTPAADAQGASTAAGVSDAQPADEKDPWAPPSPSSTTTPNGEQSSNSTAATSEAAPPAAESASSEDEAVAAIKEQLGGEVISEEPADTPATPQAATPPATSSPASAPSGPSACADCGSDLTADWADPVKKNAMRMSFVKHRRYLCTNCNH
jgi:hypothetical protein